MNNLELIKGVLFGSSIGDALGVPVEFKSREYLKLSNCKIITFTNKN